MRLWLIFLLLTAWAVAKPVRDGHVEVELISPQTTLVAGQSVTVGVHFKLDPDWHLYWKNPGATGYAPKFEWKLPEGWKAGDIEWPVPQRIVIADLQQFVYEHEVVLTTHVDVPASFQGKGPVSLGLQVEWLACAKSCVPGKASLELELPVAEGAVQTAQPLLESARAQLPVSAGNIELRAWRVGPQKAFLEYPGEAGDQVDFFPDSDSANMDSAPQWKPGEGLEIPVTEKDTRLVGVLSVEKGGKRSGLLLDVPVAASAPTNPLKVSTTPSFKGATPMAPSGTLLGTLLAAFVGGMILNLMPCVFPVLSLKALSLVRHNEHGSKPAWLQGWVYTAGVLVSVWLIAAPLLLIKSSSQSLGWGYQMQSPVFVTCLAVLFLAIALNLFGLFEVGEGLTQLAALADNKEGLSESFWSGAVATVAATPCTGPFMASALGYAVAQSTPVGMLVFTMLGLGLAFPYLLLCGIPAARRWLPRPGAWMESFKQAMGFPMLAAMVWFIYILANLLSAEGLALIMAGLVTLSLAAWIYGRWGYNPEGSIRLRAKLATLVVTLVGAGGAIYVANSPDYVPAPAGQVVVESGGLSWLPFSPEKLKQLRGEGKAVFIDFTAAWCINCKINEKGTLQNAAVVEAFKNQKIVTMKADWTRRDETISKALAEFGRTGVPFYVYYPVGGEGRPLPEVLTPQTVLDALK